mmetsp:Transcript_12135/g.50351  ORF Transcript_12135/g.50351 Transcript_12135/m.50351 type:complete len:484 (-) Transcript_12135:679-2130(-)|eukprot:CAMPEP_0113961456 /NCGR_PEP_ID=MMETSP0011_2-20120614/5316_1 /TAXON_ID=101924 /ORGANISM="Rhodosorus marinus" /LENGTH=483 /DNA_ID=CAMNT_0000973093 /DNA_START=99 /DNA_END=1550 /DNA_ORIENTATION=+ /assembly_acc=CAM_ASM_000156
MDIEQDDEDFPVPVDDEFPVPVEDDDFIEGERSGLITGRTRPGLWKRVILYLISVSAAFAAGTLILRAIYPSIEADSTAPAKDESLDVTRASVVLVSIDGFRWDYLDLKDDEGKPLAPALQKLRESGVSATQMQPVMPSKTFPNHWSIVTGLYPAWHGIIDNSMYDSRDETFFSVLDHKNPKWWFGDPLWSTAKRAGLSTAAVFWPGAEVISDRFSTPDVYLDYDPEMKYEKRVKQVIDFLRGRGMPGDREARFVTLYLNFVDRRGHEHGPNSEQVRKAVQDADTALGDLIERIRAEPFSNRTSVVVVSDHGMQEMKKADALVLDDLVSTDDFISPATSPLGQFFPRNGKSSSELFKSLQAVQSGGGVQVMMVEDTPEKWHYKDALLRPPVVSLCKPGVSLFYKSVIDRKSDVWGDHGFENDEQNMQAIFIANGPGFPSDGRRIDNFKAVDVYDTLCKLLEIEPSPNNGTAKTVDKVFADKKS